MPYPDYFCTPAKRRKSRFDFRSLVSASLLAFLSAQFAGAAEYGQPRAREVSEGVWYFNEFVRRVPWSINVVKFERSRSDLAFTTTLAGDRVLGLATPSRQISSVSAKVGVPVAAINADFYQTENQANSGDPRGLQIIDGELVSSPNGGAAFWIDAKNQPHVADVNSRFQVTWPNGRRAPFGLNEERDSGAAVLFTPRFYGSTRTRDGRELVLEPVQADSAFALRIGEEYTLKVREVRERGNTRIAPGTVVLSLGPALANRLPESEPGMLLKLSTATAPDLRGAKVAVGGNPIMIADGKGTEGSARKSDQRHPRTALGWNDDYFFFVQVDGRQGGFSVGMALPELTDYMLHLGCTQAMNLDGGGSSTLWLKGRVMNRPCYGHEREIASCLVLVRTSTD